MTSVISRKFGDIQIKCYIYLAILETKDRCPEQILLPQPLEEINFANILISDFHLLEL